MSASRADNKDKRRRQTDNSNIQDRVTRVESIVRSLVHHSPHLGSTVTDPQKPAPDPHNPIEDSVGSIQVEQGETNYVGGEHWATIANNVGRLPVYSMLRD